MKNLRPLLLTLLVLVLTLPALAQAPAWESETPLELDGLVLLMSEADLARKLGPPEREVDDQVRLYGGNTLVRVRDGQVVNLSVFDPTGSCKLAQGGRNLARTGTPEEKLRKDFGAPSATYARPDKPLRTLLYTSRWADLGVVVHSGQVVGFMLAEPGRMAGALTDTGYLLEAP